LIFVTVNYTYKQSMHAHINTILMIIFKVSMDLE